MNPVTFTLYGRKVVVAPGGKRAEVYDESGKSSDVIYPDNGQDIMTKIPEAVRELVRKPGTREPETHEEVVRPANTKDPSDMKHKV